MKSKHVTNNVYYLIFYRKNIRIPVVCNKKSVSVLNENMHDFFMQIKYTLDVILY